jgi:hypothetical protein
MLSIPIHHSDAKCTVDPATDGQKAEPGGGWLKSCVIRKKQNSCNAIYCFAASLVVFEPTAWHFNQIIMNKLFDAVALTLVFTNFK